MSYFQTDITGASAAEHPRDEGAWPNPSDLSTAGGGDWLWWLLTHSGTGSNVLDAPELDASAERTSSDNLRRIQEVLKPSVKDLAATFDVSRQTIYNWLNGDEPKLDQAARLRMLADVADVLAAEDVSDRGRLLKRAGTGGRSIWDEVQRGGDVVEFAKHLVQVARVERINMRKLNDRFAHRRRGDDSGELMPRLDETP